VARFGDSLELVNARYAVACARERRGVARAMLSHALDHAQKHGFRGMQFNFVVSANTRAVSLWTSFGFEIVGRLPQAFHHPKLGYVDAFVMFRSLDGAAVPGTSSAAAR
jgi:ribosomal protein S18 acetylase RimI-like enzyme